MLGVRVALPTAAASTHSAPIQQSTHSAPKQQSTHSAPIQQSTHSAPKQQSTHSAPIQSVLRERAPGVGAPLVESVIQLADLGTYLPDLGPLQACLHKSLSAGCPRSVSACMIADHSGMLQYVACVIADYSGVLQYVACMIADYSGMLHYVACVIADHSGMLQYAACVIADHSDKLWYIACMIADHSGMLRCIGITPIIKNVLQCAHTILLGHYRRHPWVFDGECSSGFLTLTAA